MDIAKLLCFLIAGICFILGLKGMGKTPTARRGNAISSFGMLAAVIGAALTIVADRQEADLALGFAPFIGILIGLVVGGLIGAIAAWRVQMTAMPEMVALLNGFGGIASLLIAWAQRQEIGARVGAGELTSVAAILDPFTAATVYLAALIGGLTFTGSLVAFGKLAGKIPTKPILYKGQQLANAGLLLVLLGGLIAFSAYPEQYWILLVAAALSFGLGVAAVIPIGGADMPVVISLLNSYSGLAACAAGFAVGNTLLITTGALVGASGIILTRIMCKAMNRSLANVLFSGFGSAAPTSAGGGDGPQGEAKSLTPEDAYYVLEAAQKVVIIPGYGMAVAQAQHAVRELSELLEAKDAEVRFAIHPVAGRMPGHMNVLLAEANVPYEQLVEMDAINPVMDQQDVAIVIGANDVVNPSARDEESSPIYGMPVINADQARQVFVLKRSMSSGFAGIDNPLFFKDNTSMIFGDAKATIEALVAAFKEE